MAVHAISRLHRGMWDRTLQPDIDLVVTTGAELFFRKVQLVGVFRSMRIMARLAFLICHGSMYGSLSHLRFKAGMTLEAQFARIRFQQCCMP